MTMFRFALAAGAAAVAVGCGNEAMDGDSAGIDRDDARVTVTVENVTPNGGPVLAALQRQDEFAKAAASYTAQKSATSSTLTLTFENVEPGAYAVAVFQDLNNDGGLELGDAGPTEPWALSGDRQMEGPQFTPAALDVQGNVATSVALSER